MSRPTKVADEGRRRSVQFLTGPSNRRHDDVRVRCRMQGRKQAQTVAATSCRARCRKRVGPIRMMCAGRGGFRAVTAAAISCPRVSVVTKMWAQDRMIAASRSRRGERAQGQIRSISPRGVELVGNQRHFQSALCRLAASSVTANDPNRDAPHMRPAYWITTSEKMLRRFVGRSPQRSRVANGRLAPAPPVRGPQDSAPPAPCEKTTAWCPRRRNSLATAPSSVIADAAGHRKVVRREQRESSTAVRQVAGQYSKRDST